MGKSELPTRGRDCFDQMQLRNRKAESTLPPFPKVPNRHGWFKQTEFDPKLATSNLVQRKNRNTMASSRIRSIERSGWFPRIVTRASSRSGRLLGRALWIHESQKAIPRCSVVQHWALRVTRPKRRYKEPKAVPKKRSRACPTPKRARRISSQ